jgi:hypothetical protein
MRTGASQPSPPDPAGLGVLRTVTRLQVVLVLAQAALAGQFLSGHPAWLAWHERNAYVIFFLSIAQLVIATTVARRRGPAWPVAVSGLLVVATPLQTGLGYARQLALHVPLGMAVFGLTIWLLVGLSHQRAPATTTSSPRPPASEPDRISSTIDLAPEGHGRVLGASTGCRSGPGWEPATCGVYWLLTSTNTWTPCPSMRLPPGRVVQHRQPGPDLGPVGPSSR